MCLWVHESEKEENCWLCFTSGDLFAVTSSPPPGRNLSLLLNYWGAQWGLHTLCCEWCLALTSTSWIIQCAINRLLILTNKLTTFSPEQHNQFWVRNRKTSEFCVNMAACLMDVVLFVILDHTGLFTFLPSGRWYSSTTDSFCKSILLRLSWTIPVSMWY